MTKRLPPVIAVLSLCILVALAACGGGDEETFRPGRLTDPRDVPTASPWDSPPEVVTVDPDNIQPISGGAPLPSTTPSAEEEPEGGEPGVCGTTYTVIGGDTLFGIAQKCGVDLDALRAANPEADPQTLRVGQVLKLPAAAEE